MATDADALFLPPSVRRARKKDSKHWANASSGWRPQEKAPPPVKVCALPASCPRENLWVRRDSEARERQQVGQAQLTHDTDGEHSALVEGSELTVGPEDEPLPYELLSPEESEAKSAIWHEVNKEFLEYWALQKKLKKEKARAREAQFQKSTQRIRSRADLEQYRKERNAGRLRSRSPRKAAEARRSNQISGHDSEDGSSSEAHEELDFWQSHQPQQTPLLEGTNCEVGILSNIQVQVPEEGRPRSQWLEEAKRALDDLFA